MCAAASGHLLLHRNPDTDRAYQMENAVNQAQLTSRKRAEDWIDAIMLRLPIVLKRLPLALNERVIGILQQLAG
jgi:hypothetical protein